MFSYRMSFLQTRTPESAGKSLQWRLARIGRCLRSAQSERRVSERNLSRRCDLDGMTPRGKAIEQKVVVRNDLRGRQIRGIAGEMRVGCQRHIVAHRHRPAASGVNAVFGHGTGNNKMADPGTLKFFRESRLEERIGRLLSDDRLSAQRKNRRM